MTAVRLGVNIDHVATLRRLRDTPYPDLIRAADDVVAGGADQITVHLREDRRHIVDEDVKRLRSHLRVDLNLEMAVTPEMEAFAFELVPHSICLVPEKREERTTEGGLSLEGSEREEALRRISARGREAGILVSFFIEPEERTIARAAALGAGAVELHTGALCIEHQAGRLEAFEKGLEDLRAAVHQARSLGLAAHLGHGIDYRIAPIMAGIPGVAEYNIGHALVCEAVFVGLREATRRMKALIQPPMGMQ